MKILKSSVISTTEFHSINEGPRVLFFGAIHGNETCGPKAIYRVISEIESGRIKLEKGNVRFVPVANPEANKQGKRFIDENLNRIFTKTKNPKTYEAKLANTLTSLVDVADVVLDIHSISAEGGPFIYLDFPTENNCDFAEVLGPKIAIVGWPELYRRIGQGSYSSDTTIYSNKMKKDTLLIECGQHKSSKSVDVAYKAIIQTLKHYGLIKGEAKKQKVIKVVMENVYFRKNQQEKFVKKWKHLESVKKGDGVIIGKDGGIIAAGYDGFIIMPKWDAKDGEDWMYLGRRVK